jgi:rubrerythrin
MMTDRFTDAVKEMQDKSPFVCTNCGHQHNIVNVREQVIGTIDPAYHDDFSEAVKEEGDKTAYKCDACGHHQIISKKALS